MTTERFPFAPLEHAARGGRPAHLHCVTNDRGQRLSETCIDVHAVARLLGVTSRQIHRYRHSGLTVDAADQFAVCVGRHPVEIWPAQWLDVEWTPEADELIEVAA